MGNSQMGRLPNAPLAYVLAQVVIQPVLSIETYIPKLQEALREKFPRFNLLKQVVMVPDGDGVVQESFMWDLLSPDGHSGVRVAQNMLLYHATTYTTYRDFERSMAEVFKLFTEIVPGTYTARLGLRYLDYILPAEGETLEKYVVDGIRCAPDIGLNSEQEFGAAIMEYNMPEGKMVVRFARGKGQPNLPMELQPWRLEPSAIMKVKVPAESASSILDTDRIVEIGIKFEPEGVINKFNQMHEDLSGAFKKVTTEYAMSVWHKAKQEG